MKDSDIDTKPGDKWPKRFVLAGPVSWPVVLLLALIYTFSLGGGPDSGFVGMAVALYAAIAVGSVHLICLTAIVVLAVKRKNNEVPLGSALKWGLAYYGLAAAVLVLSNGL